MNTSHLLKKLPGQASVLLKSMSTKVSNRLDGKVAIVTASTAGIGYAIAEGLAKNGAKVVISSRKQKNVDIALNDLKNQCLDVIGCVCHVGKEEDRKGLIDLAIKEYGKLDVLVNNAGINPYFGPIIETPERAWDRIFEMNVKAGFLLTKQAMPHLKETKGSVLFNSSITGYSAFPMLGAYSVSKTAILGLVKALANEFGPLGVRVNGIAPGIIDTDFSSKLTTTESIKKAVIKNVPLGRLGEPKDLAGIAVFLSSDEASYITGENILVTGGMPSRM